MRNFWRASMAVGAIVWKKRALLWEMSLLDVRDRYAGQAFGVFWAIFMPLFVVGVYLFVFALVFRAKMPAIESGVGAGWGNSYAMYLLSGLIPWMGFQEILSRSSTIITGNVNLVKQIMFPLEVLPFQIFLASFITQGIAFAAFFLYGLIRFGLPGWPALLLPVIFFFQLVAEAGCALLFSAVGVFFRDMKDIVNVLCFVLIYAMPIFYLAGMVPKKAAFVLNVNPLAHMIAMYHDALFYGQLESWTSWIIFPLFALAVWAVGCRVFEGLKPLFGNVL